MATSDKTPGVYVEDIAIFPPSVASVETAIPAFIGYTQKAHWTIPDDLILKPTPINALCDYERYFGMPQPEEKVTVAITATTANGIVTDLTPVAALLEEDRSKHILYYALRLFFANGGSRCYIVSVGKYKATLGAALVEAELERGLGAIEKEDEPTLLVIPEATSLLINDFKALSDAALAQAAKLMDRFVILDVHGDTQSMSNPAANLLTGVNNFRDRGVGPNNLKYGAAYAPNLETTLDFAIDETKVMVTVTTDGTAAAAVTLASLKTVSNARYAATRAVIRNLTCRLPPSSAVAGVYAAVDADRGVWKAPAGVSPSLVAVIQPTIQSTSTEQDQMNIDPTAGKSVNAIRPSKGQGALIWGARTLAGNDKEWRYVNVRRLFIFVAESVKKATMQFVFEPNDANSWIKVQGMIENFLTTLWRMGALQGVKPEHAFYVSVGLGKTMTPLDILEARMIVEIGMAAVRPAEFIILRFSQKLAES
jgi:phage tail sheath protein FI